MLREKQVASIACFTDVDECSDNSTDCKGPDDVCINTRGGYKCEVVRCPKGFAKAQATTNATGLVLMLMLLHCHSNATAINSEGYFLGLYMFIMCNDSL